MEEKNENTLIYAFLFVLSFFFGSFSKYFYDFYDFYKIKDKFILIK